MPASRRKGLVTIRTTHQWLPMKNTARMTILRKTLVTALPLLGLQACSPLPPADGTADAMTYTCADGRVVQATYPDTEHAQITLDGQSHHLRIARSASGARYVGDHWQWWSKGMHDARLSPLEPGEMIAASAGIPCHAP